MRASNTAQDSLKVGGENDVVFCDQHEVIRVARACRELSEETGVGECATDLSTLASYSRILDRALVLGHDHMKSTRKAEGDCERLGSGAPLSVWTSEEVRTYEEEGV